MSENEFTFTWKIENFSMLPHQKKENLSSPMFVIDWCGDVEWYLYFFPRGERSENYISCSFVINSELDLRVKCSFTIESTDPTAEISRTGTCRLMKGQFGFPYLISLYNVYANKHLYLPEDILTVRFHIQALSDISEIIVLNDNSQLRSSLSTKCACHSSIRIQRKSVTWAIRTEEPREKTFIEVTSAFKSYPGLKLSLDFSNLLDIHSVPIRIQQTSLPLNDKRLFVKCKITVISSNKEYKDSKESTHLFESRLDDVCRFPPFIQTCKITQGKYLYVENILLLHCEFTFAYKDDIYHWESNYEPFALVTRKNQDRNDWCSNIQNLFSTNKFSDVELKAGDVAFPAYKIALCALSPVFTAMFENDMKEKSSGVVDIVDVDPITLERMLAFLHIDVLEQDLSTEDVCNLYRVADKYAIESLKHWCSISLISSLSVANLCDILELAELHKDNFLMIAVHSFIRSHRDEVFYSESWKSFMDRNLKLSADVMYQMLTKKL